MSRHVKILVTVALFLVVVSLAAVHYSAPNIQPNIYAPAGTDQSGTSQYTV